MTTAEQTGELAGESTLIANIATFIGLLRRAGLRIGHGQAEDFCRALEWIEIGNRRQVFESARALLVTRREDLKLFETVFNRFWSTSWAEGRASAPRRAPRAPRHDPSTARPFTIVDYMAAKARGHEREIDITDRSATYSAQEALQRKDFSALTEAEIETLRRFIAELRWQAAERRTRRRKPHPRGRHADLRTTLRHAGRHGGVPIRLHRAERRMRERPIVLLADISGSMEKLSRIVLQFFYGVSHGLRDVETFVFGTRLTRLTPELRLRNIDRAIDGAARAVPDWSGGTRIGESLAAFNRRWGRRVLGRGAVVIIISDGWERGGTQRLRQEMAHLHRRCHRLIWLNPLAGRSGYRPLVEGMAAALPFVDDFLPIGHLRHLRQLADHLARLPARRGVPTGRSPQAEHPRRRRLPISAKALLPDPIHPRAHEIDLPAPNP